jgi:hypothetical protein
MSLIDFVEVKWRTDEKDPCVLRAIVGTEISEADPRIGFMQSIQLAREVVQTHNARLESRQ